VTVYGVNERYVVYLIWAAMNETKTRHILVSGASIAGPAIAYWLNRYGLKVTVVERSPALRGGGYPIDLRGSAVEVAKKMGIYPALQEAHIRTRRMRFMDDDGHAFATLDPEAITGSEESDVEIPRADLASLLYGLTRDDVEYRFNDSIDAIEDTDGGAHITFQSGQRGTYDAVIGADGLHSNTRRIVFGSEEPFLRYMGYTFVGCTVPPMDGLQEEIASYFAENRLATLYAVRNVERLFAFFVLRRPYPEGEDMRDHSAQCRLMREAFAQDGWLVPSLLSALDDADDVFCDTVAQIHMPRWSKGRVALVGDAAYGPSFMTGQGSSLALVGAYMLAGELASNPDPHVAFARYEELTRPFVEANQAGVTPNAWPMIPNSKEEVEKRRRAFAQAMHRHEPDDKEKAKRERRNSLKLPTYPRS